MVAGPAATGPNADFWSIPTDPLQKPTSSFKAALPCFVEPVPVLTQYAVYLPASGPTIYRACTTDGYHTMHIQAMTPAEVIAEDFPAAWSPYFA